MGHDDHRHAGFRQRAHGGEDLADALGIERRGGLVEKHQLGLHGQAAGDGDTLLLAARELARIGVLLGAQAHARKLLARDRDGLLARKPLHLDRRLDHVLQHRQMREQIELLKNDADALPHQVELALAHAHPAAGGGHPSHRLAVDGDLARIERLQEVDAREERALAGSARPDHGDHLAAMHRQIDALEDLGAAVALVQVPDANHDRRRGAAFEARRRFPGAFQQRRPAHAASSRRWARRRSRRPASSMVVRLRSRMSTRPRAITWRGRCAGEPKTRLASALVSSSCASGSSSNTMRSAGAPSAMVPARGSAAARPLTRWPPQLASARMVAALGQAVASAVASRGSKAASLIASQGFCVSLLAAPSVPSATATPAARNAGSGAIPLPSRMFDTGLCTTTVPVAASRSISGALTCTAWAHASLGPNRPIWSSCDTLLRPKRR